MTVFLYVEGGGDSKLLNVQCREGFSKLMQKAGFAGRLPRIVACGSRNNAYDAFKTRIGDGEVAILLVDSEDPVTTDHWIHLQRRDGWSRPPRAADDQAQLMTTCMETWLMADQTALRAFFGPRLLEAALYPPQQLEERTRQDVLARLERATRDCGREKTYAKGRISFQVLAEVNPQLLRALPHFQRFIEALRRYLPQPGV